MERTSATRRYNCGCLSVWALRNARPVWPMPLAEPWEPVGYCWTREAGGLRIAGLVLQSLLQVWHIGEGAAVLCSCLVRTKSSCLAHRSKDALVVNATRDITTRQDSDGRPFATGIVLALALALHASIYALYVHVDNHEACQQLTTTCSKDWPDPFCLLLPINASLSRCSL
jgi:hypothetical protein